jgi:hypothetical protein
MALGTGVDEVSTDAATALLALAQQIRTNNGGTPGGALRLAALATISDAIGWEGLRKALDVPERTIFAWREEVGIATFDRELLDPPTDDDDGPTPDELAEVDVLFPPK